MVHLVASEDHVTEVLSKPQYKFNDILVACLADVQDMRLDFESLKKLLYERHRQLF
jgi:hypothetical protein